MDAREDLKQLDAATEAKPTSKVNKQLFSKINACKQYRKRLVQNWQTNIDFRRGKPLASQSEEDRIVVNVDWALTKQKQAALFSQVPAVRVNHPPDTVANNALSWLHSFETRINDIAVQAGIETAMDESLPDCINAAGIGVVFLSRQVITELVEVPAVDMTTMPPEVHQQVLQTGLMPDGTPVPMTEVPRVLDAKYDISRISPSDFLWPIAYTGSDFDKAPWVGRSGRVSWAEAVNLFKLKEEDKKKYVGEERSRTDRLSQDTDKETSGDDDEVEFDEVYYKEHQFDPSAQNFNTIRHVIFLNGRDKPVIDEPWKGQQLDKESGELLGSLKYPIRVLSLSYITDEAIPPSDSAISRPQVNEINKSRTQMILQRQHSIPQKWFDVNRVDPTIQFALMKGTWQGYIPVQGIGTNVIGEVARSAMHPENFTFYRMAKNDIAENWQVIAGQVGPDVETKAEVNAATSNMEARIGRERAKVGKFFTGIMEVLGGLVSIFEDPNSFGEGFTPAVSKTLSYSILADSTLLLDSNQRIERLKDFVNFTAKSGWLELESVLKELATLHGLDPAVVIRPPAPNPPVEPNISLRLTGTEDMMNPLTLAFLMKSGQAPDPELIEKAKALINAAVTPPQNSVIAPDGQVVNTEPAGPSPAPAAPGVGEANPEWSSLNRVNQRVLNPGEEQ